MKPVASIKSLLVVWLALLGLLALTTGSAYLPLGIGNSLINIALAVVKAALIALFFMHLPRADAIVRLAAGAALLFLFLLAFLSFGDFITRSLSWRIRVVRCRTARNLERGTPASCWGPLLDPSCRACRIRWETSADGSSRH